MAQLRLKMTCGACPEQYDVFNGDDQVGYMRLRHGYFRAEYRGTVVYEANPNGDGCFREDERTYHLNRACLAIMNECDLVPDVPIWDNMESVYSDLE
jgi:hypothetical protein